MTLPIFSPLRESDVKGALASALSTAQPWHPYRQDAVYITEAVQPCLRKAYFNRLHPQPPSVATVIGEYLHSLLEEAFKALGLRTEVGVGVNLGDFSLTGRADVVADDVEGSTVEVGEIKTVGKLPDEPYPTHVHQLQVYTILLEAPRGTLIYINRNNGEIRLFNIKPNPEALRVAITNAQVLWQALNDYVPPPARKGAWCVFCPHHKRCRLNRALIG